MEGAYKGAGASWSRDIVAVNTELGEGGENHYPDLSDSRYHVIPPPSLP
jgi:hypothetical protein